ncbi:MAG: helix-turn-helix domain-containing protein [Cytophagales bacterium]|nr:helix-turn-helix domain-containing protein [Cytophagales bacterium]
MAHLTREQRYTIYCMLNSGKRQCDIALAIGKDKSVVSREISRNKDQRSGVYKDQLANRKYARRQKEKSKHKPRIVIREFKLGQKAS